MKTEKPILTKEEKEELIRKLKERIKTQEVVKK